MRSDCFSLAAVTMHDIYKEGLPWLFGLAGLKIKTGVFSFYRHQPNVPECEFHHGHLSRQPGDDEVLLRRGFATLSHELGHTFGLQHVRAQTPPSFSPPLLLRPHRVAAALLCSPSPYSASTSRASCRAQCRSRRRRAACPTSAPSACERCCGARGRRAPAGVMYLFFTATTTHSATPTPTHTRPVHAFQRRHPAIITDVLRRHVLGRELQRAPPPCAAGDFFGAAGETFWT